jgi:hypothetical protein
MQLSRYYNLVAAQLSTAATNVVEVDLTATGADGIEFQAVPATTLARTWSLAIKSGDSTSAFVTCASTFTHASSGAANHVLTTDVFRPGKRWVGATLSSTTATPSWLLARTYCLRKNTTGAFSSTAGISAVSGGIVRAISPSSAT